MAGEWLAATANTNMFTYEIAPVFSLMESEVGGWWDFWLISNNIRNLYVQDNFHFVRMLESMTYSVWGGNLLQKSC